jgi:hypothetical protein
VKTLLELVPIINFLALIWILFQSRTWTGPAIQNQTRLLQNEVELLKANYQRIMDELSYYIRTNGTTSEMLTGEIKAIHHRLDQLNEFHERISKMESNCLLHEQTEAIEEVTDLLKKHNKE